MRDVTSGAVAMYNAQGSAVQSIALGAGGIWVAPTTTPGAGTASVNFSSGSVRIYNNIGTTRSFSIIQMQL